MDSGWNASLLFWIICVWALFTMQWTQRTALTGAFGVMWTGKGLWKTLAIPASAYLCIWLLFHILPVSSLYSNLSFCTENKSDCLRIPWPNPLVEQIFVDIHSKYFKECPTEEFSDPPPAVIFALVITPICLIPVMVSLVVLKTKNGDGNSWFFWIRPRLASKKNDLLSQTEDWLFSQRLLLCFHLTDDLVGD